MKGFSGFVLLFIMVIGGYYVWTQLGGEVSGSAPDVGRPEINVPGPNEAGDAASDTLNDAADEVATWSLNTWKMILLGLAAFGLSYLWYKNPKFKYIVIGVLIAVVVIVGFV